MNKQAIKLLALSMLLLALPAAAQADFYQAPYYYRTYNSTVAIITGYDGPSGEVIIPGSIYVPAVTNFLPVIGIDEMFINGWVGYRGAFQTNTSLTSVTIPNSVTYIADYTFSGCTNLTSVTIPNNVTSIGFCAFNWCSSLTSVTIPNSVTTIGAGAFESCLSLTSITIPNGITNLGEGAFQECFNLTNVTILDGVTSIGNNMFWQCTNLTSVTIPDSVINIGIAAFSDCISLTGLTIPNSVTSIGIAAFSGCTNLTGIYFCGNAPRLDSSYVFYGDNNATVYYLPGMTNWSTPFGGRPAVLWLPQVQTCDASFGVQTNQFGFNVNWSSGQVVVVEACTNLANPDWQPVQTNTLMSDSSYFSDPQWTNYPGRFYRLRSP